MSLSVLCYYLDSKCWFYHPRFFFKIVHSGFIIKWLARENLILYMFRGTIGFQVILCLWVPHTQVKSLFIIRQ